MRWPWHVLIAGCALLSQAVPIAFMHTVAYMTFGKSPLLPEAWVWPLSLTGLVVCSAMGFAAGIIGSYITLTRSRPLVAALQNVFFCFPAMVGGIVYAYSVLVFLALA